MHIPVVPLKPEGRWHVPFQDDGAWRLGIYQPEFFGADEIHTLEKHSCTELFICTNGKAGLVVRTDTGEEQILTLQSGEAVLVHDWHNGFRIDEDAFFYVTERTEFITRYMDRKSGLEKS